MKDLFFDLFKEALPYREALSHKGKGIINITGLTDNAKPHFLYGLLKETNKKILVMAKNEAYAKSLNNMLSFFDVNSHILWEREFNFFNIDVKSTDMFISRINTLYNAANSKSGIFITTFDALTQPVIPKSKLEAFTLKMKTGDEISLEELSKKLGIMGYQREPMVEFKGQFSVRGDIVDIFSPLCEFPYRIEFFGDEIDSIRLFDEKTQKSLENLDSLSLTVAGEVVFSDEEKGEILENMRSLLKTRKPALKEEIKSDIEKLETVRYFPSIDKYISLIYKENNGFLSYFDEEESIVIIDEPQRISERKEAVTLQRNEQFIDLAGKQIISGKHQVFLNPEEVMEDVTKRYGFSLMNVLSSNRLFKPYANVNISVIETPNYYGKLELFCEDVINFINKGYRVVIPVPDSKLINIRSFLNMRGIFPADLREVSDMKPGAYFLRKKGIMGFNYPEEKFILLYDSSIFGEYKPKKPKKIKEGKDILSFSDLTPGDYVVHNTEGIGKYLCPVKMEFEGITRDYLKIQYHGSDVLYLPISELGALSKYIGTKDSEVKLSRFGGQEFKRVKERVRRACAELADKLIGLYAKRQELKGHQYMADTDLQAMFEDTFPYEETDDQLRSISEVKSDMESQKPMDRLLCGDVGYGKTEVAMRAAFKCACEGKQTAYLASTTVLAQQHYNSFKSRMEGFPVKVEMLSRFKTKKEQEDITKRLKSGSVDIIIGTHRILSKDVEFKDLGLLIVDEEQRFGVEHKEKLKLMKDNIEVLTLSATPIPRTLHMSMLGIRDMSVLKEPPQDRLPVQTYVTEYNEGLVAAAINKELARGGQVFYLYNKVQSIERVADKISALCPHARVKVAHGQMSEGKIEKTFIEMINGEIDVLVCTTIIETGIDIGNANTIIVENADALGLSQLYQLRGRVGRTNRLAYCYLTYGKNKSLTEISEKRLKTIKEFTEFGSGFKIALRDLEIRGAGNVLGAAQHGHMDAVGYDMYMRILEETIKAKKGETVVEKINCKVDIKTDAYIPDSYIENHDLRMDMYKKIASVKKDEDLSDILDELYDRFSELPEPCINLCEISLIKAMAEELGIFAVTDFNSRITFKFADAGAVNIEKLSEASEKFPGRITVLSGQIPAFSYKYYSHEGAEKLSNVKNILQILK